MQNKTKNSYQFKNRTISALFLKQYDQQKVDEFNRQVLETHAQNVVDVIALFDANANVSCLEQLRIRHFCGEFRHTEE